MDEEQRAEVEAYVREAERMSEIDREAADREKTGVFTGGYAVNPVNQERIPVWIADYVLMTYGSALELIIIDKKARRFVMRYHVDRCAFCAQCVQSCRFGCLEMTGGEWELAANNKKPFVVYYGDEEEIEAALSRQEEIDG